MKLQTSSYIFIEQEILTQVFFCKFCEIFFTFFTEHLWTTAYQIFVGNRECFYLS